MMSMERCWFVHRVRSWSGSCWWHDRLVKQWVVKHDEGKKLNESVDLRYLPYSQRYTPNKWVRERNQRLLDDTHTHAEKNRHVKRRFAVILKRKQTVRERLRAKVKWLSLASSSLHARTSVIMRTRTCMISLLSYHLIEMKCMIRYRRRREKKKENKIFCLFFFNHLDCLSWLERVDGSDVVRSIRTRWGEIFSMLEREKSIGRNNSHWSSMPSIIAFVKINVAEDVDSSDLYPSTNPMSECNSSVFPFTCVRLCLTRFVKRREKAREHSFSFQSCN